jgi:hypothetical protein
LMGPIRRPDQSGDGIAGPSRSKVRGYPDKVSGKNDFL